MAIIGRPKAEVTQEKDIREPYANNLWHLRIFFSDSARQKSPKYPAVHLRFLTGTPEEKPGVTAIGYLHTVHIWQKAFSKHASRFSAMAFSQNGMEKADGEKSDQKFGGCSFTASPVRDMPANMRVTAKQIRQSGENKNSRRKGAGKAYVNI